MTRYACMLLGTFVIGLASTPALALDVGAYSGEAQYGGDLTMRVKGANVFIEVQKPGCQGDIEGPFKKAGKDRWTLRPDMPGCVIEFRKKGKRVTVIEGNECFQLHGTSCSFDGVVTHD